ncbi:MAG: hypothetical protein HOB84_13495 [Candidatus Marinimicrobia bacterium]|nr:hypothetical protein [Candidatus Neomarinimicrobiota bacterium]MBT4362334.1 hypothetical protein [Candidatus Neomarinimicrobiota bacterium]MBT4715777.1 hypothetical protein [Candidatus Neomarinimicrobiota bacterium]MBT4947989.1 hypothetical protein [Candidatus Neomarinimicrobiota bacterium]MBT5270260.1 hypothetical protein [Candidatus Neomarinimicrobiota bacterium]
MKIDLRKDRGILEPRKFLADESSTPELSEDELIAETMRRRRTAHKPDTHDEENIESETTEPQAKSKAGKKKKDSKRNPLREFILLILMVSITAYYLHDKGILFSTIDMAEEYVYDLLGIDPVLPIEDDTELDQYDEYFSGDSLVIDDVTSEEVLPDEVFNELMPMTEDIAALADSIASAKPESLHVQLPGGRDTVIVYQEFTQVSEEVVNLTDDDISIINNRSLLLMVTEMVSNFPIEYGSGHLFLKRDALSMTAPRGGEWVAEMKSTLDKFVLGSYNEDYSSGTANISSKFEIIMNAEKDFQGQSFDAMRLLDILANPFTEYLEEIVIDPVRQTDDNPVQIVFSGSAQEIQYILSSWSESRSNYLIGSIDIDFQSETLVLTFSVTFFNYSP